MPKKPLESLTESMFYVLMAFGRGSMCGIQVVEFIQERTNGRIQMGPATVYTILGKYEQEGYIEEIAVEGRKRTYQITPRGHQAYQEEVSRLTQCVADAAAEVTVHESACMATVYDVRQDRPGLREGGLQICPC